MSKYAGWAKRKMAGPRGHSNRAWSGGMGQGRSDADVKAEKEKKKEFDSKQDAASSFRGQQERRSENQRGSGNEIKALKSGHGAAALKRMVLIEDASGDWVAGDRVDPGRAARRCLLHVEDWHARLYPGRGREVTAGFEWGVFVGTKDENETHVAPSRDGLNVSNHVFEGITCWCQPRRDPVEPRSIIHNQPS